MSTRQLLLPWVTLAVAIAGFAATTAAQAAAGLDRPAGALPAALVRAEAAARTAA